MIILHCAQTEIGLLFWAERKTEGTAGKTRSSRKVRPHPFALDCVSLFDALDIRESEESEGFTPTEALIWLPARDGRPIPSNPILGEENSGKEPVRISPFRVDALYAEPCQAVELLAGVLRKKVLKPGVLVGPDMFYWGKTLQLAGAIVARQEYLPGIRTIGTEHYSVWEPVLLGETQKFFSKTAKAMPPVARALSNPVATSPPEALALDVLKEFLTDCVDQLVRSSFPSDALKSFLPSKRITPVESVHDAWMHALKSTEGKIHWNPREATTLVEAIGQWRRPILVAAESPYRLCFRLKEPDAGESKFAPGRGTPLETWRIEYLLQPRDDQSLLTPLGEIWRTDRKKTTLAKKFGNEAREFILLSLGQAAGICPRIAESLKASAPDGYELDSNGAYEFLTERSIALRQADFGVMLPAWWTGKGTKLRPVVRAKVKSPVLQSSSGLSLETIVQFNWEASLGEERLTRKELEVLAKLKTPLVRLRGQWVEVNAKEIQAALRFWEKQATEQTSLREIVQMALGVKAAPAGFVLGGIDADGWIEELLSKLEGRLRYEELQAPEGFTGTLRPYQIRGYSWLSFLKTWGLGACLADDMGLGKTVQALVLIRNYWPSNKKQPTLLVCPTSVVNNWLKEAERFVPGLPVMVHHGLGRKRGASFKKEARQHALVISTYGLLQRDIAILGEVHWAGVILDEAQNIKNPETKQAKAARSLKADYRATLTGTPVENNVGDLWSIMEFLNPGFLGSQAEFRRRFFIPIQTGRDPEAAERLRRITTPFILRRLKTDKSIISDLPDKIEMKEYCTLTKEQASLYAAVLKEVEEQLESAEGIQRKGLILSTLLKLKQVCNHPAHFLTDNSSVPGRSGKLSRLTEMLEEIFAVGDKALVFTQFTEMGDILKSHLQDTFGQEALFLHGGVARNKRDKMVERFQANNKDPAVFILSLKAGGTGLNLTAANHVFHFDRWWNPAVENQATDRAFRIGQTRNVMAHKFICTGTLEERIDEMIERKKDMAENVIGTGEAWLTELSNEELKGIFALRKEATGD